MENTPLVSIITPTYNSMHYIELAINSVLNQTYSKWELFIIDDCSNDQTVQIVRSMITNEKRIKLIQLTKNLGAGPARNIGIEKAKGKYIAFLDSDDFWIPQKLSIQIEFMENNNIYFSHSSYGYCDESGIEHRRPFIVSNKPIGYIDLLKRTEISCLTAIYNQEVIGKIYMPNIRRKQDYALWLSILKRGFLSYPQRDVLAYYRQRKGSSTSKKYKLIVKHYKFLKESEKLSSSTSLKYTLYWIWNGLFKYYF